LTPEQLRQSSAKHLTDAQDCLVKGDHDRAAYDAGFAAELALKARYCSRKGLPVLPDDKKVLKWHKLNTHDLDSLLRLSDSAFISRGSMNDIDWSCISDWDNEDRYKAAGSVSKQVATKRVEQSKLLAQELIEHEIVEALARARDQLLAAGVDLGLLAWAAADYGSMGWVTHLSSFCLDDPLTREQRMLDLHSKFTTETPVDLWGYVTTLEIYG
jgi:HEPN domain-containing protein